MATNAVKGFYHSTCMRMRVVWIIFSANSKSLTWNTSHAPYSSPCPCIVRCQIRFLGYTSVLQPVTSKPVSHPRRSRLRSVSNPTKGGTPKKIGGLGRCFSFSFRGYFQGPAISFRGWMQYLLCSCLCDQTLRYPPSNSPHQDDMTCLGLGIPNETFICHYYWEGGQPKPNPWSFLPYSNFFVAL